MENRFAFLQVKEHNVKDTVTQTCTVQENESQWEVSVKESAGEVYR